jgi:hypothetical protein
MLIKYYVSFVYGGNEVVIVSLPGYSIDNACFVDCDIGDRLCPQPNVLLLPDEEAISFLRGCTFDYREITMLLGPIHKCPLFLSLRLYTKYANSWRERRF